MSFDELHGMAGGLGAFRMALQRCLCLDYGGHKPLLMQSLDLKVRNRLRSAGPVSGNISLSRQHDTLDTSYIVYELINP